jgi:hypothetical protein
VTLRRPQRRPRPSRSASPPGQGRLRQERPCSPGPGNRPGLAVWGPPYQATPRTEVRTVIADVELCDCGAAQPFRLERSQARPLGSRPEPRGLPPSIHPGLSAYFPPIGRPRAESPCKTMSAPVRPIELVVQNGRYWARNRLWGSGRARLPDFTGLRFSEISSGSVKLLPKLLPSPRGLRRWERSLARLLFVRLTSLDGYAGAPAFGVKGVPTSAGGDARQRAKAGQRRAVADVHHQHVLGAGAGQSRLLFGASGSVVDGSS